MSGSEYERTAEEIAVYYKTGMESVELINEIVASGETDDVTLDHKERNIAFLKHFITQTCWTNEDMTPFDDAIKA